MPFVSKLHACVGVAACVSIGLSASLATAQNGDRWPKDNPSITMTGYLIEGTMHL